MNRIRWPSLMLCALILGLFSSLYQIRLQGFFNINSGVQYIAHRAVLEGTSYDPFQYRILSEHLADWSIAMM